MGHAFHVEVLPRQVKRHLDREQDVGPDDILETAFSQDNNGVQITYVEYQREKDEKASVAEYRYVPSDDGNKRDDGKPYNCWKHFSTEESGNETADTGEADHESPAEAETDGKEQAA